eukprot:2023816-Pyramimonas_sp.AAC.1
MCPPCPSPPHPSPSSSRNSVSPADQVDQKKDALESTPCVCLAIALMALTGVRVCGCAGVRVCGCAGVR